MNNYTIIIPIHDAFDDVVRCVESVRRNTPGSCIILLCDDGSNDDRLLKWYETVPREEPRLFVHLSNESLGFVSTVNNAVGMSGQDVIILNSDTIVPPGWVERLDAARQVRADSNVAAVCPLSNNATAYSVPNDGGQELPPWLTPEQMDDMVFACSEHFCPLIPTVHGFCMLLTREALNDIGSFDEVFGRGYGEEVDWSRRAIAAGYSIVLADNLFVYHRGHASFGSERDELVERAEPIVLDRWPDYPEHLHEWRLSGDLCRLKTRLTEKLRRKSVTSRRLKVLLVQHNWNGMAGLEIYTKRMAKHLAPEVEYTILHPSRRRIGTDALVHHHPELGGCVRIEMNSELVGEPVVAGQFPLSARSIGVESFFGVLLDEIKPDVVHVQHMGGFGTFRFTQLARDRGIPSIWGLHDHYQLCPLMLNGGECRKRQCGGDDQCLSCLKLDPNWLVKEQITDEQLKYMLEVRQLEVEVAHGSATVVTVPSNFLANEMWSALGKSGLDYRVIPHGIEPGMTAGEYQRGPRFRVGWFGAGSRNKGFETFLKLCREANFPDVDWSVHAPLQTELDYSGLEHVNFCGPFADGELGAYLNQFDVAVVAASRVETYGAIVDEVTAHGCPVIVAGVPAIVERYQRVDPMVRMYTWGSAGSLYVCVAAAREAWIEGRLERKQIAHKSFEANMREYLDLYNILAGTRATERMLFGNSKP